MIVDTDLDSKNMNDKQMHVLLRAAVVVSEFYRPYHERDIYSRTCTVKETSISHTIQCCCVVEQHTDSFSLNTR